jgi:hypothetical protein
LPIKWIISFKISKFYGHVPIFSPLLIHFMLSIIFLWNNWLWNANFKVCPFVHLDQTKSQISITWKNLLVMNQVFFKLWIEFLDFILI